MQSAKTFLIVDDDRDDREFFAEAVSTIYPTSHCESAWHGEDALKKLKEGGICHPDFIFLDLNMPLMDGRTCLSYLKKDTTLSDIPVIIFTTSSNPKDKEELMMLGASYFLTKPISFSELCKGIEKAVETVGQLKSERKLN